MSAVLDVKDLQVSFHTRNGVVRAVDRVSLKVGAGQTVGIVGNQPMVLAGVLDIDASTVVDLSLPTAEVAKSELAAGIGLQAALVAAGLAAELDHALDDGAQLRRVGGEDLACGGLRTLAEPVLTALSGKPASSRTLGVGNTMAPTSLRLMPVNTTSWI